jgi:hypothetical protein
VNEPPKTTGLTDTQLKGMELLNWPEHVMLMRLDQAHHEQERFWLRGMNLVHDGYQYVSEREARLARWLARNGLAE